MAAGLATLAMAAGLAVAPAQAVDKTRYIALGDCFAAGKGAGPYLDDCYRTEKTYSELADDAKAVQLVTNAACGGARTEQVVNTQLRQLNKSTELVSITAGGNSLGFGEIITYCGAALSDPTAGPACAAATDHATALIGTGQLTSDVIAMIQSVKAAAPNARIIVTGYPYLYDPVTPNPADPLSLFISPATFPANGLNGSVAAAGATGPVSSATASSLQTRGSTSTLPTRAVLIATTRMPRATQSTSRP